MGGSWLSMHEGDPQIHLSGNVPAAGTPALKSIRTGLGAAAGVAVTGSSASAASATGIIAAANGAARKFLRFRCVLLSMRMLERARCVDIRNASREYGSLLVGTHPVEQD